MNRELPVGEDRQLDGITRLYGEHIFPLSIPNLHANVSSGSDKGGALRLHKHRADFVYDDGWAWNLMSWPQV